MISIEAVREDSDAVAKNLARRGVDKKLIDELASLDITWRELTDEVDSLRAEQNSANADISAAALADREPVIEKMKVVATKLKEREEKLKEITEARLAAWRKLPNMLADDVPEGPDESGNVVVREVGEKPQFNFTPKPHWDVGKDLDIIDTERAAEVAGSRFSYLKGKLVQVQFALIQFVLDTVTSEKKLSEIAAKAQLDVTAKPFVPVLPPVFIRPEVMDEMGRLEPREDRYHVPEDDLYLVGSAEHTLGPLHRKDIIPETDFPLRYIGYSTSFRRESGSHGRDVRGILRMHQFDKLEFESFSVPENSLTEQNFLVALQEYFMQSLELPYRVVMICTGDMGDPDARQIDIEAWMPGQDTFRETHTSDLMTDYQSRRLQTKVRRTDGSTELVHMNDATAIAMSRVPIALIENHQQEDGSIAIPKALHPYLAFEAITAD